MNPLCRPMLLPAAALLLSSCAQWQLGEYLSDTHTTYTGVDTGHPVDGKTYHPEKASHYYMTAPELTYKLRLHPALNLYDLPNWECYAKVYDARPTGRILTVKIEHDHAVEVSAIPKGLRAEERDGIPSERHLTVKMSEMREAPGPTKKLLINACDYVADPLLTALTLPIEFTYHLITAPFTISQNQQEEQAARQKKNTPTPKIPYQAAS